MASPSTVPRRITRRQALRLLRRVAVLAVFLVAIGVVLLRRVVQVAVFLLASGLHMLFGHADDTSPAAQAHGWDTEPPPTGVSQLGASRVVVTFHPWYQSFQVGPVVRCLDELAALGAGYVRTDVRWRDVLPDGSQVDEDAVAWYRAYFQAARVRGLRPLAVLSQPPAGLTSRYSGNPDGLLAVWGTYIDLVATRLGDLCDTYQVLNEPNNPVYVVFDGKHVTKAIALAAERIRRGVPEAVIAMNILVDLLGWREAAEGILMSAGGAVDVVGLDHYPGTWTFSPPSDWDGIATLLGDVAAGRAAAWSGVELAVMETGYATNLSIARGDAQQVDYFRALEGVVRQLQRAYEHPLALVGVYELCDADSSRFLDPEAHFGLLTSGSLARKPAFTAVQTLCAALQESGAQSK